MDSRVASRNSDDQLVLKNRLREVARQKGLSFKDLSKESGVPLKTLYGWTAGNRPRNLRDLQRVAECLGVSLQDLSFGLPDDEELPKAPSQSSLWIYLSRGRARMSPVEAAAAAGITVSELLQYEAGRDVPLMHFLKLMAVYQEDERNLLNRLRTLFRKAGSAAL